MKSRKNPAKPADTGSGRDNYNRGERHVSISSASAQSESSLASRNFFYDDNINTTTPQSKPGFHRTTEGNRRAMTSSGNNLHRSGGTNTIKVSSPATMNVRADVEASREGRRGNRVDETQRNISTTTTSRSMAATNSLGGVGASADVHRTPATRDALPTIVVDDINIEDDSGTSTGGGGRRRSSTTMTSNNNAQTTREKLLTKSDRNVIAAELAYHSSPYHTQPHQATTPTTRRQSKDLLHRSYDQTYEGRTANGTQGQVSDRHKQRNERGIGKIEGTAAEIVEDAIEKALEAIYGKRKTSSTTKTDKTSTTTVERSVTTGVNGSSNYDQGHSSRVVRSVVDDIRDDEITRTTTSSRTGTSPGRRRSSSSPRPMTAVRSTDRLRNEQRYGSSEWCSSDCYLSPVQSNRNQERNVFVVGSSGGGRATTRRTSGYASDTALFSPPPSSSTVHRLVQTTSSSVHNGGDIGRSASTDSDFSTTLEIRNPSRKRQQLTTDVDTRSLDRQDNRQRNPRPVTLTKGMVTKVVHGLMSDHAGREPVVSSQSPDGSRYNSLQLMAHTNRGVISPPPGVNVISVPTVHTGLNANPQSVSYGMRPLDVDVVDRSSMMTSSRAYLASGTRATPPVGDYDVTSPVRIRQATDRRVDLLINPGKQRQQQHSKFRVFGATGSNGASPAGLPAIAEYNIERRVASAMSTAANEYSAYSNEPLIVTDLVGPEINHHEWLTRRAHSLDDLRTPPLQHTSADERPSGASVYSTSATTKPNINMSSGQVLNMYLFGRPRSVDLPPVRSRDLERPSEVETLTKSIMFDDNKKRVKQPLPVRRAIDEQTQTADVRSRNVGTMKSAAKSVGTSMAKSMSTTAVQTERKIEQQLSPMPIELMEETVPTMSAYVSSNPPEPYGRKKKEPRQTRASNVVEQTIFVRPNIVETRQMEMTGDVFATRPSQPRDNTDGGRQMAPVAESPVVMQRKPTNDSSNVDDFFARESSWNRDLDDGEGPKDEDEDIMMETEIIEEKQQRIEMTIREDIEFSLQRTQGTGKPSTGGDGTGRTNIEPWWIPPRYEAFVDRKKQRITQIKEIENSDDYSKKVDHGNANAQPSVASSKRFTTRDNQTPRYDGDDDEDGRLSGPFRISQDVTIDTESNTRGRDVKIPVQVEKAYVSPVLELGEMRSPPLDGGRYKRTASVERNSGSPTRSVASPQHRTVRVDVERPPKVNQTYVTSYTRYITPPSSTDVVGSYRSNIFNVDEPPTTMQSPTRSINVLTANDGDDDDVTQSSSSLDGSQWHKRTAPSWSNGNSDKVTSTIADSTSKSSVFPKTKITLPMPSAGSSPTLSTLHQSAASHRKPADDDDDDDGDRLPDSLDHFDRMLSHLEREILTTNVDDDQRQFISRPRQVTSDRKQAASSANSQVPPASVSNTSGGKTKPPPPPPLKKSWKVAAFDKNKNTQQPPSVQKERQHQSDETNGGQGDRSVANNHDRFSTNPSAEQASRSKRSEPTTKNEFLFTQQLADNSTIMMNLMEHNQQQQQQQPAKDNLGSGNHNARHRNTNQQVDAWYDTDLARTSSALQSPAFVSSSWKSLERRHRVDVSGTERVHPREAGTESSRREPNGYETMITAL